jgi:hypothetical protein
MKRTLFLVFVSVLCSAVLVSQSLVEVSKKEKERREQFKGKNVRVVTNADLKQVNKKSAVSTTVTESSSAAGSEPGATESPQEPESPPSPAFQERQAEGGQEPGFARAVLPETFQVNNAEAALYMPDGKYAEISVNGVLELEVNVKNGPGDDLAVYARWTGGQEGMLASPDEMPLDPTQGVMSYGVLAMTESGDWEEIGRGAGISSPEKFDLGSISSTKKIMIMFKPPRIPSVSYEFPTLGGARFTMGIDAVVALNQ